MRAAAAAAVACRFRRRRRRLDVAHRRRASRRSRRGRRRRRRGGARAHIESRRRRRVALPLALVDQVSDARRRPREAFGDGGAARPLARRRRRLRRRRRPRGGRRRTRPPSRRTTNRPAAEQSLTSSPSHGLPTGRRGDATSGDASRGDSSSHGVPPGVRGGRPTTLAPNGGDAVRGGEEEVLAAGRRSSICGRGERVQYTFVTSALPAGSSRQCRSSAPPRKSAAPITGPGGGVRYGSGGERCAVRGGDGGSGGDGESEILRCSCLDAGDRGPRVWPFGWRCRPGVSLLVLGRLVTPLTVRGERRGESGIARRRRRRRHWVGEVVPLWRESLPEPV